MSGFTIACILGNNSSSSSSSIKNNLKRKLSDENEDNEHQLHKRQTIEGNKIVNCLHISCYF